MALPVNAPPLNVQTQGAGASLAGAYCLGNDVWILTHAGVPTGGAGWAGPGSLAIDYTNSTLYQNTGTKATPVWTQNTV